MSTFTASETLETIICYKCAVLFAMPQELQKRRLESGGEFFCPNGHEQHYSKSRVKILEEQLESERKRISTLNTQLQCEKEQHEAERVKAEKLKRRIARGVCPCCKRTVHALASHIKTKHPDYIKSAERKESA